MASMSGSRRIAFGVLVVGAALVVALIVGGTVGGLGYGLSETLFFGGAMIYFLVLGISIIWRVPGNRIGWVFALMAVGVGVAGVAGGLADRGLVVFDAIGSAAWMVALGGVFLLLLWYPTGRVSGRFWRLVEVLALALLGFAFFGTLFSEQLCVEAGASSCEVWADNPIGVAGVPYPEYWPPFAVLVLLALPLSIAALIARYRRAGQIERLQLKWFLLGGFGFIGSILAEIAYESAGAEAPAWVGLLAGFAILAMPVAATLAILRYRLYEIDRIISRTVSYALVIGLLGSLAFGLVTLLAFFLPSDDPLVVAVATLVAAASFNPLRRRLQRMVDRRFNRTRYDSEQVMQGFAGSLRERVDPEGVVAGWLGVVEETMQPVAVGVWMRE